MKYLRKKTNLFQIKSIFCSDGLRFCCDKDKAAAPWTNWSVLVLLSESTDWVWIGFGRAPGKINICVFIIYLFDTIIWKIKLMVFIMCWILHNSNQQNFNTIIKTLEIHFFYALLRFVWFHAFHFDFTISSILLVSMPLERSEKLGEEG